MCIAVEIQRLGMVFSPGIRNSENVCFASWFASWILQYLLNQQLFQKATDDAASFHKHICYDCMKAKFYILFFNRF